MMTSGQETNSAFDSIATRERERIVAEILSEMSHPQQAVLGLHFGGGWRLTDIARFVGQTRQSIWETRERALAEFRRKLEGRGITRGDQL